MSARGVRTYSLIHATVRARYSTLLSPDTWDALIRAEGFDTVMTLLSKTAYGPHLQLDRQLLSPRRAAYQIKRRLSQSYEKLTRLASGLGHKLVLQLWRLYEVGNLKATLRGIVTGATWNQVLYLLYPMARYTALPTALLERMVLSRDVGQAINLARDTPYSNTLNHALERFLSERSLFPLEVALDLDYHRELWQIVDQCGGLDREWALRLVGGVVDSRNLLWAIRYRVFHHLSEEEIINYTLPFGYRVHDDDIRAIATGGDINSIVKRLYPNVEGLGRLSEEPDAWLSALEVALQRDVVKLCRSAFLGYPFHIGVPIAYLLLSEREIRDLTVVIEAKASDLPTKTFAPLLQVVPPALVSI